MSYKSINTINTNLFWVYLMQPIDKDQYKLRIDAENASMEDDSTRLRNYQSLISELDSVKSACCEEDLDWVVREILQLRSNMAMCFFRQGDAERAFHEFELIRRISALSHSPDLLLNCAACLHAMRNWDEAVRYTLEALIYATSTDMIDRAYSALGNYYYIQKKYTESIEQGYARLSAPNSMQARHGMAFSLLAAGRFKEGFEKYESRLALPQLSEMPTRIKIPSLDYWDGKVPCKKLLVVYEQGLGDNIQFFRFVIALTKKNPSMEVHYFCHNDIAHLFECADNRRLNIQVVHAVDLPLYTHYVYITSLPYILGVETIADIPPPSANCIARAPLRDAKWRTCISRLRDNKQKVIALTYKGRLHAEFIEKRVLFEDICRWVAKAAHCAFVCLHPWGEIKEDWETSRHLIPSNLVSFSDLDSINKFNDTVSILRAVDGCIAIDSVVAHIAGTFGVPTQILLGAASEWRWGADTSDCYWYPSVTLRRSERVGDSLIEAAVIPQAAAIQPTCTPAMQAAWVPIAVGELYDKISILEIKVEHGLCAAQWELDQLSHIAQTYWNWIPITELYKTLKEVNRILWDAEDAIRAAADDSQIAVIARKIYQTNDRRASIKRSICAQFGTNFVEYKNYSQK